LERQLVRPLADEIHQRAQVLEIEQQQALVVGDLEGDREHALLGLVQPEQPRQQHRAHLRHGGADRMTLLAEQVPEHRRKATLLVPGKTDRLGPFGQLGMRRSGLTDAGQVALHVGHEHRDAMRGKSFGQHLERHRLARAGRAGDQTVAVGKRKIEQLRRVSLADQHGVLRRSHCSRSRWLLRLCLGAHLRQIAGLAGSPDGRGAEAWTVSLARTKW
jgi:hypothetical protein